MVNWGSFGLYRVYERNPEGSPEGNPIGKPEGVILRTIMRAMCNPEGIPVGNYEDNHDSYAEGNTRAILRQVFS